MAADYPVAKRQIIIVDDGSSDGTEEYCRSLSGIDYIRHDQNRGRAETRNSGLRAAAGRICFFLDDDQVIPAHFFTAHLERYHRFPDCVGTVGQYRTPEKDQHVWGKYLESRGAIKLPPDTALPAKYFQGGNISIRSDILSKIGGFDPLFDSYGGEDSDMGQRLSEYGPIYFTAHGYSYHHGIPSLSHQLDRLEDFGRKSLKDLLAKHPDLESTYNIRYFKFPWNMAWSPLLYRLALACYRRVPRSAAFTMLSYLQAYRVYRGYRYKATHPGSS